MYRSVPTLAQNSCTSEHPWTFYDFQIIELCAQKPELYLGNPRKGSKHVWISPAAKLDLFITKMMVDHKFEENR